MTSFSRRGFVKTLAVAPAAGSLSPAAAQAGKISLPGRWTTMESAEVRASGDTITASTGRAERVWRWTGRGLATESVRNTATGKEWSSAEADLPADWSYEGLLDPSESARLIGLIVEPVRFDPFTSDHIRIQAELEYPKSKLALRYTVRIYPGAPGFWTQLRVKGLSGYAASGIKQREDCRADFVPIWSKNTSRRAIGYYNQTQQRNKPETELLREEIYTQPRGESEVCDWASIYAAEEGGEGICLIKESHKCVNQQGVNTGLFQLDAAGLANTGWGPAPADILTSRYRACWASWSVVFDGGDDGREMAIKIFDRKRYPLDAKRDIYIMANTWGSGGEKSESLDASREENILRQIESCQDLGIDVQQIDDGWQGNQYKTWHPVDSRYPKGWTKVRTAAREAGIKLGLWAAWVIDKPALLKTFDDGGFNYYKIDFANLDTYDKLEDLMAKMRSLITHSGDTVRVNWDVTENPARVGYYFARELGNIYLENRKPFSPPHVVYIPHLVLRDAWHVAHYLNLNKFQITVQNIERINPDVSDAHLHNHPYAVAMALMSSPIFFQETSYYTAEAREQIRPLLALYKQHREAMYRGYVFAIGDKPDNSSWTGFQNHDPGTDTGYLMVYRERQCPNYTGTLKLRLIAERRLRLTDLVSGEQREVSIPRDGKVDFSISTAPGFQFLRYELI